MENKFTQLLSKVKDRVFENVDNHIRFMQSKYLTKITKYGAGVGIFALAILITLPTQASHAHNIFRFYLFMLSIGGFGILLSELLSAIKKYNELKLYQDKDYIKENYIDIIESCSVLDDFGTELNTEEIKELFEIPLTLSEINFLRKNILEFDTLHAEDIYDLEKKFKKANFLYKKNNKVLKTFMEEHGIEDVIVEKEIELGDSHIKKML